METGRTGGAPFLAGGFRGAPDYRVRLCCASWTRLFAEQIGALMARAESARLGRAALGKISGRGDAPS